MHDAALDANDTNCQDPHESDLVINITNVTHSDAPQEPEMMMTQDVIHQWE